MKLSDIILPVVSLAPDADRFSGTQVADYHNMKNYKTAMFVVVAAAGGTGTFTVVLKQATSAAGGSATAIPFKYRAISDYTASDVPGARADATASGITVAAGANQLVIIEIDADELDEGYNFVGITTTEVVDSPIDGAIMFIGGEPRFQGVELPTSIA